MYLSGIIFELVTDHKDLELIFLTLSKSWTRIERWILRLQPYPYKVVYETGKSNIADCLSILILYDSNKPIESAEEYELHISWVTS